MSERASRINLSTMATWTILCLLATGNVFLLSQNLQLRGMLDDLTPKFPRAGDRVGSFDARGLDGQSIRVEYGGGEPRRVFLYFTPACPYCEEQFGYWRELLTGIDSNEFEVSGIVSDSEDLVTLSDYLESVGCDSLRLVRAPARDLESYKLTRTPITILVSAEGIIEKSWVGLWNSTMKADVAQTLGVTFMASVTNNSSRESDDSRARF